MTDKRTMDEFKTWIEDTQYQIKDWTKWLENQAYKKSTYGKASGWLERPRPQLPDYYTKTAPEAFSTVVTNMFTDARKQVIDKAMKEKTK